MSHLHSLGLAYSLIFAGVFQSVTMWGQASSFVLHHHKSSSSLLRVRNSSCLMSRSCKLIGSRHCHYHRHEYGYGHGHGHGYGHRYGHGRSMTNSMQIKMVSSDTSSTSTSTLTSIPTTAIDAEAVQHMLYRIRQCNHVPEEAKRSIMDFVVDGQKLGKVTEKVAKVLCEAHDGGNGNGNENENASEAVFEIIKTEDSSGSSSSCSILTLSENAGSTLESRTKAVKNVMDNLRDRGVITGWRDELYGLTSGFYEPPVLLVERAAASFLGMLQYGVHVNGLVKSSNQPAAAASASAAAVGGEIFQPGADMKMWMARRSMTKSKYPGYLDQVVAGGQPAGLGLMENVLKECMEEAGIPDDITLQGIEAAGAISYEEFVPLDHLDSDHADHGLVDGVMDRIVLFNYDLTLPSDVTPTPVDGEVEEFFVWGVEDIVKSMDPEYHDPIKPNCYICIIDYLMRKGIISPDTPGYLDVLRELRSGDCA